MPTFRPNHQESQLRPERSAQPIRLIATSDGRFTNADPIPLRFEETSVLPDTPDRGPGATYPCPLSDCDWELFVEALDVADTALASVFGIGVMASAAAAEQMARTEEQLTVHLEGHSVIEWSKTVSLQRELIVSLQRQLQEAAAAPVFALNPDHIMTAPTTGVRTEYEEMARLQAENDLLRSRQAQQDFDPLKATPRYSDQLPSGVVGVRR